jgi:hypothetical protein
MQFSRFSQDDGDMEEKYMQIIAIPSTRTADKGKYHLDSMHAATCFFRNQEFSSVIGAGRRNDMDWDASL